MRVLSIILIAGLVGLLVGGAVAYVEVSSVPVVASISEQVPTKAVQPSEDVRVARVEIDETEFNFGTMQQGRKKSHTFLFKNTGTAPLTLSVGKPSCKCTVGNVTEGPIPPGGTGSVTLEWTALTGSGPFRQTAPVHTNDPLNSTIDLVVQGDVVDAEGIEPREFNFGTIPVGEEKSAQVFVMAMLQDQLTVSDPKLSDPVTADKFDIEIVPVDRQDLPTANARAGVMVSLTAKPGLPVGRFNQWLALTTNLADGEHVEIPVLGRVVGDISVRGLSWNEEQGVAVLGRVKSSEGERETLNLMIRGPEADKVEFEIASCDPPELKATIGERKKLRDELVHVPLTIEVPIGTRPMVRTDTAQGEAGRIVLTTTHPKVKELVLGVRFSVER